MWLFERTPLVKNTTKIQANTLGILAVNGTSIITFPEALQKGRHPGGVAEVQASEPGKAAGRRAGQHQFHRAMLVRLRCRQQYPTRAPAVTSEFKVCFKTVARVTTK